MAKLTEAVGDHNRDFCYACYSGNYPTLINIEEMSQDTPPLG